VNQRATFQIGALSTDAAPEFHAVERPVAPQPASHAHPELAWIPKYAWPDEERKQRQVSRMFENSLRTRMAIVADQEKREWQKVDSRGAWERFRDQRLTALRKWLGPMPDRTPLAAVVTRRANYGDGFAIENIVFESRPHLLVTANLYLPEHTANKVPAIVVVHSHHAPKTQSELQDLGMTMARSGTAVLVMDQLAAGERSQSQPWPRESYYGRYALGNQLLLAGESLTKWMVWDLMRAVDLLLERLYIDPQRIVMLGAVAGGGDPAAVASVLDPRIAAVIPFNFGEAGPEEHYTYGPRGYDSETAWPGWGEWETTRCLPRSSVDRFFPWFLCAAVAPRPFVYAFEIDWPKGVDQEPAWARYQKVFELYGARDRLDQVHGFGPFPGPGECTNIGTLLRQRLYPILNRWLNIAIPAAEYHNPRPDSDLMCLTPAVAVERRPRSATEIALQMARLRLAESRSGNHSLSLLRKALQEKLGDIEPSPNPAVQHLWTKSGPRITVEALAIQTDRGITLPVYLLKPVNSPAKPVPVVLAIAQGGKAQFLVEGSADVAALLQNGIAVCLPDLRDTGELASTPARGPGAMDLAESELMLGGTMLGARLKDVRTVFQYLLSRPDIEPSHIAVWGDSFAQTNPDDFKFDQSEMQEPGPFAQHQAEPMGALLALLTGLYEDRVAAVAARGGLVNYLSVLGDRFCHVPQDVIVPGILEAGDVPDIVSAQGSRRLLLERFVDGRNRVAQNAPLQPLPSWLANALRQRR
jgi:dienelactone hydrolase